MKLNNRLFLLSLITISTLLVNLAFPVTVFADDATPPPVPTEEATQPPVVTDEPTQPPVVTDEATQPPTATDEPVVTEVPTQEPAVDQENSVGEILSQVPDGTDVVVLDENGNPLPMASQEAADIIETGDPQWCMAGHTPFDDPSGGTYCTKPFPRFTFVASPNNIGLIQTLINDSASATPLYTGPGTIFIAQGNIANADQNKNIVLDGSLLSALSTGALTIQGGWDFAGQTQTSNQSVFKNSTFQVVNWGNDVTINDIKFNLSGISGNGLSIDTISGDATVDDVTVTGATQEGLSINGGYNASVSNSTFNNNSGDGLDVHSSGEIDVNNVTANRNGNNGAYLVGGSEVNLTGTNTFDANINQGLHVGSSGDINLNNNVEANRNGGDGANLDNCAWDGSTCTGSGDINLTGTNTFDANGSSGLEISSTGDIKLNNIEADRNTDGDGAYLDNTDGSGSIYFTGTNSFNNNKDSGLEVYSYGDITFDGANDINANRNGDDGLHLYNAYGGVANITLNNITANFNVDGHGVFAYAAGDVTINNGYFKGNDKRGVYAQSDYGNIDVSISQFINNGMSGLRAEAYSQDSDPINYGNITLDGVYSVNNGIHGANLGATGNITIEDSSEFSNNDESGVHIMGLFGDLSVFDSLFSENNKHGLDAEYVDGNVNINGSVFTYNKKNGLNLPDVGGFVDITASDFLNNKHDGAYLDNSCNCTISDITINSNSSFNDNGWNGLVAYSDGEINLEDIKADGNTYDGVYLDNTYGTGNIFVDPTGFNDNGIYGLEVYSNGNIDLSQVTANGNGNDGVYLDTSENARICDSNFNSNGGFGINASHVDGTLTIGNSLFSGNTPADYVFGGSNFIGDCNPVSGGGGGKKSTVVIPVTGEGITCEGVSTDSITIALHNGDFAIFPCPIKDFAFVQPILKSDLPGALKEGLGFLSALNTNVTRDNAPVKELDKPVIVSFVIPAGVDAKNLTILFWNGTEWQDLGGAVSADGLHFEVSTNQLGTFVLAKK